MRVLEQFDFHKHSAALEEGKTLLYAGTHNPVPTSAWQKKYLRYRHQERFLVSTMQGSPQELAPQLPRKAICVLEGGEVKTFPIVRRSGFPAVRTENRYIHALDTQGEVWPAEAVRGAFLQM